MDWDKWVLDASASNEKWLCFCPVEGDLNADYQILTGISTLSDSVPNGKLVGVIHSDGQEAVEAFCEKHRDLLDALKNRGGKMSEPICECGHRMSRHENHGEDKSCRELVPYPPPTRGMVICDCKFFKDTRIATLEAQLAEARKDSKRLEWLVKHGGTVLIARNREFFVEWFSGETEDSLEWTNGTSKTPREAIDAAIEAAGKERGE